MTTGENKITTFKGFDKKLKCRGFQFKIGEEIELTQPSHD